MNLHRRSVFMGKHPVWSFLLAFICMLGVLAAAGCSSKEQSQTEQNARPQEVVASQNPTVPNEKAAENKGTAIPQPKTDAASQPAAEPAAAGDTPSAVKEIGSFLTIEGEGVNKVQISLNEMENMQEALVEDSYFSLNNWGTKQYFDFKGVSLWSLLKSAGVKDSAQQVVITAKDGYSITYAIAEVRRDDYIDEQNPAKKYKMIIAWQENGKAYDPKNYPFRLVVGQKAPGDLNKPNWVQNVQSIKVD
jgi:DMSO/TMAO reductase YedYZ molybdopterin-dependent catalytic subunit